MLSGHLAAHPVQRQQVAALGLDDRRTVARGVGGVEQFTPVIRRAEMLRFGSIDGRASVSQHDELIRLCAAGDAEAVAAIAYDTWHSLPSGTVPPGDGA